MPISNRSNSFIRPLTFFWKITFDIFIFSLPIQVLVPERIKCCLVTCSKYVSDPSDSRICFNSPIHIPIILGAACHVEASYLVAKIAQADIQARHKEVCASIYRLDFLALLLYGVSSLFIFNRVIGRFLCDRV